MVELNATLLRELNLIKRSDSNTSNPIFLTTSGAFVGGPTLINIGLNDATITTPIGLAIASTHPPRIPSDVFLRVYGGQLGSMAALGYPQVEGNPIPSASQLGTLEDSLRF